MNRITLIIALLLTVIGCDQQNQTRHPDPGGGIVDVMTFNIRNGMAKDGPNHWDNRKQMVVDVIEEYAPDVAGLQEAFDFQADYISRAMPQYGVYYICRKDGKKEGESCAIYYLKNRYDLADSGTFWFSDTPNVPSTNWGNWHLRICSWVRLIDKANSRGLYVYNLHLDHRSQPSRENSAKLLAKMISQRKTKDPYIVMGDFNMTLDNPGMKYLVKDGVETPYPQLYSAWHSTQPKGRDARSGHGFKNFSEGKAIDHILVENNISTIKANIDQRKINGRYPSDHYPVTAKLKLY